MTLTESINRALEHCNRAGHLLYHDKNTGIDNVYLGPSKNDRVSAMSLQTVFLLCVAHTSGEDLNPVDVLKSAANSVPDYPLPDFRHSIRALHGTANAVAWLTSEDRVLMVKTRRTEGDDSIVTQMPLCIYLMGGLNKFDFPSYIEWFKEPKATVIRSLEAEAEKYIGMLRDGLDSVTRQELIDIDDQRRKLNTVTSSESGETT